MKLDAIVASGFGHVALFVNNKEQYKKKYLCNQSNNYRNHNTVTMENSNTGIEIFHASFRSLVFLWQK